MPWTTIGEDSQITAIHSALLPTEPDGVVLYYGDWTGGDDDSDDDGKIEVQGSTYSRRFRMAPSLKDVERIEDQFGALPTTDCFCGGQSFLADGRLLSAGGTLNYDGATPDDNVHEPHYDGERACWIYLPRAKTWVQAQDLNFQPDSDSDPIGGGRWYPSLVTLGNGEVFAVGGHPTVNDNYVKNQVLRHNNNTPERYSPGSDRWALLNDDATAPSSLATDSYPRFHLLPDGVLFSDTAGDAGTGGNKRMFDPFTGGLDWRRYWRTWHTAALL